MALEIPFGFTDPWQAGFRKPCVSSSIGISSTAAVAAAVEGSWGKRVWLRLSQPIWQNPLPLCVSSMLVKKAGGKSARLSLYSSDLMNDLDLCA